MYSFIFIHPLLFHLAVPAVDWAVVPRLTALVEDHVVQHTVATTETVIEIDPRPWPVEK